jgi:hypothetical protein
MRIPKPKKQTIGEVKVTSTSSRRRLMLKQNKTYYRVCNNIIKECWFCNAKTLTENMIAWLYENECLIISRTEMTEEQFNNLVEL